MGKRPLTRLAAVAAGGVLALAAAAPAIATDDDTINADLRQSNVAADDQEFAGGDCEGVDVGDGEAGWVFVWPGNQVTELVSLELNFDTDGDGTADVTLTESDATPTLDQGTLKVWVTTDADWVLVNGTSEVKGALQPPKFNLTHICGGGDQNGGGENGDDENGDDENGGGENGGGENGGGENGGDENGGDENREDEGLPVTGSGVGTLLMLSGGMIAVGGAMLLVRRRRRLLDLLNG